TFADVVAGEQDASPAGFVGECRERRLDETSSAALLERDADRRARGGAAQRAVDLIGEVGERVRKCVVDRDLGSWRRGDPRELAILHVRVHETQLAVEDCQGERNGLEQRLEL